MNRRNLFSLLGALALVLFVGGAKPATAAVVVNERLPFAFVVPNCDGDPVFVEGEYHLLIQSTKDGCFEVQINAHGTGIDLDGNEYVWNDTVRSTECFADPCNFSLDQQVFTRLISKGSEENLLLHTTFHFEVVDCNLVDFGSTFEPKCVG